MRDVIKKIYLIFFSFVLINSNLFAEEEEIYLKSISDQIQVITKDLKTLEKAVYQKSDATNTTISNLKSDGLNEDILTKHLLKLNEIENQFRELTNKFEEVNFKLDKLSTRVTKIQSDTQLRFSDLENGTVTTTTNNQTILPGPSKPQDFGSSPGYQMTNLPKQQKLILLRALKQLFLKNLKKSLTARQASERTI